MEKMSLCENCAKPAKFRCGRCRAIALCSRECQVAGWRKHKPDCIEVVASRERLEALGIKSAEPNGPSVSMSMAPADILALNDRAKAVYDRHGLKTPPLKGSAVPTRKKLEFFLDMLQTHDSSARENASLPLNARLLLNRRYNNTYRHAVETFEPGELDRLNEQMRARRIGAYFK